MKETSQKIYPQEVVNAFMAIDHAKKVLTEVKAVESEGNKAFVQIGEKQTLYVDKTVKRVFRGFVNGKARELINDGWGRVLVEFMKSEKEEKVA